MLNQISEFIRCIYQRTPHNTVHIYVPVSPHGRLSLYCLRTYSVKGSCSADTSGTLRYIRTELVSFSDDTSPLCVIINRKYIHIYRFQVTSPLCLIINRIHMIYLSIYIYIYIYIYFFLIHDLRTYIYIPYIFV